MMPNSWRKEPYHSLALSRFLVRSSHNHHHSHKRKISRQQLLSVRTFMLFQSILCTRKIGSENMYITYVLKRQPRGDSDPHCAYRPLRDMIFLHRICIAI